MDEKKLTLIEHLEELRKRLIISLVALFWGMLLTFIFWQDQVYSILMAPLNNLGRELVLLTVTEGFMLQIKIAFLGGLIIASPVILWQIIGFVLPALYKRERKTFWLIFISSILLFILGILFAYCYVLGVGLEFLLINCSGDFVSMLSASKYLSFTLCFLVPFGVAFQIPIVTYIFTKLGILTPKKLRQNRSYIIVTIFIIAAILTPPDVFSQIMLALPMLFLYEVSIIISILVEKRQS